MALQIRINKKFLKELSRLPKPEKERIEHFIFVEVKNLKSLNEFPGLTKLKGFKHYYRLRFGEYRAGISVKENSIVFERLLHRKDIYKFFP